MFDEDVVEYEGYDDFYNKLINDSSLEVNESILSNRSLWFGLYEDLSNKIDTFDINKKKLLFPEIYWGERDFDHYKEEMKKRYIYLAKNALFLLAPLVRRESDNHYNIRKYDKELKNEGFDDVHQLYMIDDIYLSVLLEKLLFGSEDLEDNELYKGIEALKDSPKYLEKVKDGLVLMKDGYLKENINDNDFGMFELLSRVRSYILGQPDCINKQRKLCILDEYFRILRYSNDGRVWFSGYEINPKDNLDSKSSFPYEDMKKGKGLVSVKNRGVGFSKFINAFEVKKDWHQNIYVCSSLTEKEKQDIYLKLHDELPWDLEIDCVLEEAELDSMNDSRLVRPDNTKPCGARFVVEEGNIFVTRRGFYHLCSECGYIVKVPPKLISEGIGNKIKERCSKDQNLFRKMELLSELQALDDRSLPQHKVLFK